MKNTTHYPRDKGATGLTEDDDDFTATLYVTELDENPYYSDEEWEMWLYENIFETNDWEVTAEMIV